MVIFPAGIGDAASIVSELPTNLPVIPQNTEIISALSVALLDGAAPVDVIAGDETFIVSFVVPSNMQGDEFSILYWDPTLNNGQGDWVELEITKMAWDPSLNNGLGGWTNSMSPLLGEVPAPVGTEQRIAVEVNFTGLFVLVTNGGEN